MSNPCPPPSDTPSPDGGTGPAGPGPQPPQGAGHPGYEVYGPAYPGPGPAYGYPNPYYAPWPPQQPRNGPGTAGLVLGIIGCVVPFVLTGVVGLPVGILALVFGIVGRSRAGRGQATNGGAALAGIIMGAVSIVLSILLLVALVYAVRHNMQRF